MSSHNMSLHFYHDTAKKAKAFISLMLQRNSSPSSSGMTVRGTVDFVYSGSRVKVLLPSENCVLQVTLSQVHLCSPYGL